jgi:CysZ protein
MIKHFTQGVGYVRTGFDLISRPGMRRYVGVPLVINVLLFASVLWFGYAEFERLLDWMLSYLPGWLDWLRWILWPLFAITTFVVVFYLFTPVANLLGAPFNALLAEKLEAELSGQPPPETRGAKAYAAIGLVALGNELRKLLYMLLWAIPILFLFMIPGINLAAPFLWLTFSSWMLALEYADYPMGVYNMRFAQERRILRRHRSLALGFGGALMLMTAVPIINFFAMPVGVAGATALWVERMREQALAELKGANPKG